MKGTYDLDDDGTVDATDPVNLISLLQISCYRRITFETRGVLHFMVIIHFQSNALRWALVST